MKTKFEQQITCTVINAMAVPSVINIDNKFE